MPSPETTAALTAFASAIAGGASAVAAIFAVRLQRRWGSTDAFLRLSEQFETPAFRTHRTVIYGLDRNAFATWTDDEVASVNAWCAHLDLVAVLIQSRQLSEIAFLNLYGDVVLRTVYQVAPYCNHQVTIRGKQFLLPLRMLTGELVRTWRRRAGQKYYPVIIGFPAQPQLRVSPDLFDSDDAVRQFRVDRYVY